MVIDIEDFYIFVYELLRELGYGNLPSQLAALWDTWSVIAGILSLCFLAGIAYAHVRLSQVEAADKEKVDKLANEASVPAEPATASHRAWEQVLEHAASESPGDWRLAILEADILLDQLVEELGYIGETLGERLRGVNRANFKSIDAAWEAHRVRNRIAHEGAAFQISEREARRVIDLYRSVFEEFGYVPR